MPPPNKPWATEGAREAIEASARVYHESARAAYIRVGYGSIQSWEEMAESSRELEREHIKVALIAYLLAARTPGQLLDEAREAGEQSRREAQGRAWDAFAATNDLDRGSALRAGFDAGVEWTEEHGDASMVKWFVEGNREAEQAQVAASTNPMDGGW